MVQCGCWSLAANNSDLGWMTVTCSSSLFNRGTFHLRGGRRQLVLSQNAWWKMTMRAIGSPLILPLFLIACRAVFSTHSSHLGVLPLAVPPVALSHRLLCPFFFLDCPVCFFFFLSSVCTRAYSLSPSLSLLLSLSFSLSCSLLLSLARSKFDVLTFFFFQEKVGDAVLYGKFPSRDGTGQHAPHQMHIGQDVIQGTQKGWILCHGVRQSGW